MTWFKVDDSFHSHPKVLAAPPAALGLWVVAGAWCSANLTDGFVPDYVLQRLLPDAAQLAGQLVTCGLWRRAKGGYRFHDWSQYQPTKEEATAQREKKSIAGALGNHRRWHTKSGRTDPSCPYCQQPKQASHVRSGSDRTTDRSSEALPNPPDPTRPDPIKGGLSSSSTNDRAPAGSQPPRCPKHLNDPDPPPCGQCADLRRARDRADTERRTRQAGAPRCRVRGHEHELADPCRLCRSEQLAPPALHVVSA